MSPAGQAPALVVHGGAWDIPTQERAAHRAGCKAAAAAGWKVLARGGSALDAVVEAVVVLEDDPTFDAGRGSFLNQEGEVELDASMMTGPDLEAGAVASVRGIANPVKLARVILESPHVTLVGPGATAFALQHGFELCPRERLVVPREQERWEAAMAGRPGLRYESLFGSATVGAVARDRSGAIAATTSTGGSPLKPPGRVGDSPLIGCGTYASAAGGVSCTGYGEAITRVTMARMAVLEMELGVPATEACALALGRLAAIHGLGGLISVDGEGRVGWAFNTPHMAFAYQSADMDEPVAEA